MFRRLFVLAVLVLGLALHNEAPGLAFSPTPQIVAYANIPLFASEAAAEAHCPGDTVVWLNTRTGIWHEKGMRWYGHTKEGAYVCRKEAAAAGYRDTRNGQ